MTLKSFQNASVPQIRPLEEAYKFGHFFSPLMTESDFEAKPSVRFRISGGSVLFAMFVCVRAQLRHVLHSLRLLPATECFTLQKTHREHEYGGVAA